MAYIVFDDDSEMAISSDDALEIKEKYGNTNIPDSVEIGMVFDKRGNLFLLCAIGKETYGFTSIREYIGAYSSSGAFEKVYHCMRDVVNALKCDKDVKYIGMMQDVCIMEWKKEVE